MTPEQHKELQEKIKEKAERAFTYQKLVSGLKNDKFKKIVVCTGQDLD